MKLNTILDRYIFADLIPPFIINMLFFMVIFLITRVLDIVNLIVNYHVSPLIFGMMLLYSMPFFLTFIIPMSVMMAILLTFLRMSGANEIVALKSCGISPHRFLVPVVLFCLLGWALTSIVSMVALPRGNRAYNTLSVELAQSHIDAIFKERTFIDGFEDVILYVNHVDMRTKTLVDVFIEDQRTRGAHNTIIAPKGRIAVDADTRELHLKLFNGAINQVDLETHSARSIDFETYDMKLSLARMMNKSGPRSKKFNEMSAGELRHWLHAASRKDEDYYKALMKYHEKFSVPAACLALGLLALPLGMQVKTSRRSAGVVTGIVLFLVYYILLSVGWSFGESGALYPTVGMWAPNVVMGGLGIYLYLRSVQAKPALPEVLKRLVRRKKCNI
jgi:lipopolysaccharide export system permease protein